MSQEAEVAVLKTRVDGNDKRLDAHSDDIKDVQKVASENTLAIVKITEGLDVIRKIVYGCVGVVLLGVGKEIIKAVLTK